MHNVDFCWYTCFWIHKYIQVQNCGPWGVPCSHCFCNSVKSTWWEWKIMCWGRVGDYEYLAKYSGKFQKYFSIQVNKRIHPPNFQAFATSLIVCLVIIDKLFSVWRYFALTFTGQEHFNTFVKYIVYKFCFQSLIKRLGDFHP